MTKKAPGKSFRKGLSLKALFRLFPDDATAEAWFIGKRWPNGIDCPVCGSLNVKTDCKHKTMPYRCREKACDKRFSAKTGTVMEGSKLGLQTWMIATSLMTTSLRSVSSMKLHRDLDINPRSAWFLAHRLRTALAQDGTEFSGPVEADETFFGGRRRNMSNVRRKELADTGRGSVGKSVVAGLKDRGTKRVRAKVVDDTTAETLQGFVRENTEEGAMVYTDEAGAYNGLARDYGHEAVRHSVSEFVRGQAHTNGIESLWSMLKRAHKGTFHKISARHLDRYVSEFATRHNIRDEDTLDQMAGTARAMAGKRLKYHDLIADNGLESGARS